LAYKNTPFPKQYTILSNKWGAVQRGREGFLLFDYWITMVRLISLLE